MNLERADFSIVTHERSLYMYAFGGTVREDNCTQVEKYDSSLDVWILLSVRLQEKVDRLRSASVLKPSEKKKQPKSGHDDAKAGREDPLNSSFGGYPQHLSD